jgi:hypothetical protein
MLISQPLQQIKQAYPAFPGSIKDAYKSEILLLEAPF